MKTVCFKYIAFVLLVLFSSCRKDESTTDTDVYTGPYDPKIEVIGGVTGWVTDESGIPVSEASVSIYNQDTKTDENGIFYVNNVPLNRKNSNVIVKKSGYFNGYKTVFPRLGGKSFVEVQLVSRGQASIVAASNGGKINVNGGATIDLPANGFVVKNGGVKYDGDVHVFHHWYDPQGDDLLTTMPGNLSAIRVDGSEAQLATYGMMAVELESPDGKALQLSDNQKATLRFPVNSIPNPPSQIPLWSFDEMDGVWVEENTANLMDGEYVAEVSHFSFWNCDAPFPLVHLKGTIVSNNIPVQNIKVRVLAGGLVSGYVLTDVLGNFSGKVPANQDLVVQIVNCGEVAAELLIGPFASDTDIGTVEVVLENFQTVLTGRLVDCLDLPLPNAYGLIRANGKVKQVITPLADGTFSTVIMGCNGLGYTVQFIDPENLKSTPITEVDVDVNLTDFGDLRICDDLEEYVVFSIDGNSQALMTNVQGYITNGNKLLVRADEPGSYGSFALDVFALTAGAHNPSSMSIQNEIGPINPELFLECGDNLNGSFTCDQISINLNNDVALDGFVSGSFSGTLVTTLDTFNTVSVQFVEYQIEGSFRVQVDQAIVTGVVSGSFWFDENGNDNRDGNENIQVPPHSIALREVNNQSNPYFHNSTYALDGKYIFTNVPPGTYYVQLYSNQGYQIVDKNVGAPETDNDFFESQNYFITNNITITSSEQFEDIDAGFEIPNSVNCGSLLSYGCTPNISLYMSINGGVPPYNVSLSDGQTLIAGQYVNFDVSSGGSYSVQLTDAVGNTCEMITFAQDYNNRVRGRVWRDMAGGVANFYDFGVDFLQQGILMSLKKANGDDAGGSISTSAGFYQIEQVPPGDYYIEVDVPSNMTLLLQNVNLVNGNDIDPVTMRSDVFTVGACDFNVNIDVGLRLN